jgi:hypothetical protein
MRLNPLPLSNGHEFHGHQLLRFSALFFAITLPDSLIILTNFDKRFSRIRTSNISTIGTAIREVQDRGLVAIRAPYA